MSLFSLYGDWFPRYEPIFKIVLFLHETWTLEKVAEVAHLFSFYPKVLKLRLFLLYVQQFPRYWPIFKIAVFGYETWSLTKDPKLAHTCILFFYHYEVKIELIFAVQAAVCGIRAHFQNYHI